MIQTIFPSQTGGLFHICHRSFVAVHLQPAQPPRQRTITSSLTYSRKRVRWRMRRVIHCLSFQGNLALHHLIPIWVCHLSCVSQLLSIILCGMVPFHISSNFMSLSSRIILQSRIFIRPKPVDRNLSPILTQCQY